MRAQFIRITGRVQGVYFRSGAQKKARELHIAGWVRNTKEGSVEIHAEGEAQALKKLKEWCHTGPPSAIVESVVAKGVEAKGYELFEILE
ncbi:acylphosphatase [Candidatus Peregrinibacteria bacterium CG10_big_fil_rev_8_21_14_0_10_49_10]|nr:MAG: acylphosphatase [Candidatus Peregrinibacteria bacterium CG10_big_fil_rev_8_21_14_0_10_49_10]